jgi:hypothetical protein
MQRRCLNMMPEQARQGLPPLPLHTCNTCNTCSTATAALNSRTGSTALLLGSSNTLGGRSLAQRREKLLSVHRGLQRLMGMHPGGFDPMPLSTRGYVGGRRQRGMWCGPASC